jgi:DNA repair protein RadC
MSDAPLSRSPRVKSDHDTLPLVSWRVPAYRVCLVRDASVRLEERPQLRDAPAAVRLILPLRSAQDDGVEHFGVLLLDIKHRIIGSLEISVGMLTGSLVHPREVFGPALAHKAAALILFHNHPSGDPEPSLEDLTLTRRLAAGGQLLGIEVLDHIVVGDGTERWVSLRDRDVL